MQKFSQQPQFPYQEQLKCPRCDSTNTKFCYYNNYNLSQPRHFCKSCRRYWIKGGALRNVPIGGGSRKAAKRAAVKRKKETVLPLEKPEDSVPEEGQFGNLVEGDETFNFVEGQFGNFEESACCTFSSLLVGSSSSTSGAQFGGLLDGLGPNGPSGVGPQTGGGDDGFLDIEGGGWPDLAI